MADVGAPRRTTVDADIGETLPNRLEELVDHLGHPVDLNTHSWLTTSPLVRRLVIGCPRIKNIVSAFHTKFAAGHIGGNGEGIGRALGRRVWKR